MVESIFILRHLKALTVHWGLSWLPSTSFSCCTRVSLRRHRDGFWAGVGKSEFLDWRFKNEGEMPEVFGLDNSGVNAVLSPLKSFT